MKLDVTTGKVIREYLEVALGAGKGSDSISNSECLAAELMKRLNWKGENGELFAAIENLRKAGGLPAIDRIKELCCGQ